MKKIVLTAVVGVLLIGCSEGGGVIEEYTGPKIRTGLKASALNDTSIGVRWGGAYDEETAYDKLEYKLISGGSAGAVDHVGDENTAAIVVDWTPVLYERLITDAIPQVPVYFNVLVRDTDGNVTMYKPVMAVPAGAVYAGGTDSRLPVYWCNGKKTSLEHSAILNSAWINGIAVGSNDLVHSIGSETVSNIGYARYWKGTAMFRLSANESSAHDICLSGDDVYISGVEYFDKKWRCVYWKNGQPVYLSDKLDKYSGTSIAVENGDVYVSTDEKSPDGKRCAVYWKNDVNTKVLFESNAVESNVRQIECRKGEVYSVGSLKDDSYKSVIWKNGKIYQIAEDRDDADYDAIAFLGNNLFIAGSVSNPNAYGEYYLTYWENQFRIPTVIKERSLSVRALILVGSVPYVVTSEDLGYTGNCRADGFILPVESAGVGVVTCIDVVK